MIELMASRSGIGWYGPLIDLSSAAFHVGDLVQLIVFVHRSTPLQVPPLLIHPAVLRFCYVLLRIDVHGLLRPRRELKLLKRSTAMESLGFADH